jgi:hypothetical protein
MRRLLSLVLGAVLLAAQAQAAIAFVQQTSCGANDATCTFSAAPLAANKIIILATVDNEAQTIDITGFPTAEVTIVTAQDSPGITSRFYAFCIDGGDGADVDFVATTSGTGIARVAAAEFSGMEACASVLRNNQGNDTSAATSHPLTTDLTTVAGDEVMGFIHCTGTANLAASSATSIPGSDAEIANNAQGQYKAAAGVTEDTVFTSAVAEDCFLNGISLKEASVAAGPPAGSLMLLGVGK